MSLTGGELVSLASPAAVAAAALTAPKKISRVCADLASVRHCTRLCACCIYTVCPSNVNVPSVKKY